MCWWVPYLRLWWSELLAALAVMTCRSAIFLPLVGMETPGVLDICTALGKCGLFGLSSGPIPCCESALSNLSASRARLQACHSLREGYSRKWQMLKRGRESSSSVLTYSTKEGTALRPSCWQRCTRGFFLPARKVSESKRLSGVSDSDKWAWVKCWKGRFAL